MAPPAKRQKRNVLSSSSEDDDEPDSKPKTRIIDLLSSSPISSKDSKPDVSSKASSQTSKPAPTKPQPRAKTANHPPNAAPIYLPNQVKGTKAGTKSASTSPEKPNRKRKIEDKVKSGNIHTFFTKQAQRQQTETTIRSKSARATSGETNVIHEDIISDDDDLIEPGGQSSSSVGLAARKRVQGSQLANNAEPGPPSASQKFIQPPRPVKVENEEDTRPWAERFSPVNLDELAVHKKKVSDVRAWLESVMGGKLRQRLLLLKGAAGTGKTTTIQLLAKDIGCDVLEWHNPVGSVASSDGYLSMATQFEEFMARGGKFGQLDIFSSDGPIRKPETKPLDRRKNLMLVEEFPNTFTRSSTILQSFRSSILSFLASNTPPLSMMYNAKSSEPVTPVILIVSETLLTTTSASADSFTAHRLLGPEILQHPGVGVIEFNAIAPTILAKALELVVQKESRKSGRRKTPGPVVLKRLGEVGDIRSAIGSLEFLCLRGDTDGDWGAKVAFARSRKADKESVALTKMEQESLEMVTRREASLGIFHAVGKVVYNKRDEAAQALLTGKDVEKLPDFMSLHARPRKSQISVDELIDETGTDTQTFVAALHENYILSCDASPTSFDFSSLDHVNGCIDALSDADLLCPSWDGSFNSSGFGGGTGGRGSGGDILRQDEISFQIAVRGILFSLPFPVKRKAPAANGLRKGQGGDAFKMFYPTSLKLWRAKEEIESTIDLWVTRLMKGEEQHLSSVTAGANAFLRPKPGTVESWKSAKPSAVYGSQKPKGKNEDSTPLMSVGTSARKEMLLERLPYMVQIAKSRRNSLSMLAVKDMEKVTTFRGIGAPSEDTLDETEDVGAIGEEWATDKPSEGRSPQKRGLVIRGRGIAGGVPIQQEQKLVLSDDDIEDD